MSILLQKAGKQFSKMDVLKETKRILSLTEDSPLEDVDPSVLEAIQSLLMTNPDDTCIDLELGPGQHLGRLTCMEENCWDEIPLLKDPKLDDGGLARGLGGWRQFQIHCKRPDHIEAREARLKAKAAREKREAKAARENEAQSPLARNSSRSGKSNRSALGASRLQESIEGRPKEVISIDDSSDEDVKPLVSTSRVKPQDVKRDVKPLPKTKGVAKEEMEVDSKPGPSTLRAVEKPTAIKRKRAFSLHSDDDDKPLVIDSDDEKPVVVDLRNEKPSRPHDSSHMLAKEEGEPIYHTFGVPQELKSDVEMQPNMPAAKLEPDWMQQGGPEHRVANNQARIQEEIRALAEALDTNVRHPFFAARRVEIMQRIAYLQSKIEEFQRNAGAFYLAPHQRIKQYCRKVWILWSDAVTAAGDAICQQDLQAIVVQKVEAENREREQLLAQNEEEMELDRRLAQGGKDALTLHIEEAMADFMDDQSVDKALQELGIERNARLPGLEISLMPHQILGVNDMLKKERSKWKGGILADAMGLGKTVQAIAVSVANPPAPQSDRKSILIVAPVSLLGQWAQEIAEKTTSLGSSILIYHGPDKPKRTKAVEKYKVVITSYSTLVLDAPGSIRPQKKKKKRSSSGSESDEKQRRKKAPGPLFKIEWHRVILDESAVIRNPKTLASIAVSELEATYRWSVTGTLVTNGLNDLYAQFRFLGAGELATWSTFRDKISKAEKRSPAVAARRAQAALKLHGIRRTKDSVIDGKPILQLPEKTIVVHECVLDEAERQIYSAIESKAQVRFNNYLKAGTVMKSYHVILLLLLRLKQTACHPQLVVRRKGEPSNPHDLQIAAEAYEKEADNGNVTEDRDEERQRAMASGGQGLVDKLDKAMTQRAQELSEAEDQTQAEQILECPVCSEPSVNIGITACAHVFCRDCLANTLNNAPEQNADIGDAEYARLEREKKRPCPLCRMLFSPADVYNANSFGPEPEAEPEDEEALSQDKLDGQATGYLKGAATADEDDDLSEELKKLKPVEPSTKMRRMQELVDDWLANTDDKILIFSQFTSFLDLISIQLNARGIAHAVYDGRMSREAKEDAVTDFKSRQGPRVMLLSIKSGNVGLNLTCANKAITMDLQWAWATEAQAHDRCHRIGQTRPVEIHRIIVKDSIDDRILALQERKKGLGDACFGEGTAKKQRMTLNDLVKLFDHGAGDNDD